MAAPSLLKLTLLTCLALVAFAANSVLCRLALGNTSIDAASFTAVRLIAAALTLLLVLALRERAFRPSVWARSGSIKGAGYLFVYAASFSLAYVQLDTATGALILFGTVQLTMILVGLLQGQKLNVLEAVGLAVAFSGFVYLILPGLTTPSAVGFVLMMMAGIAWGFYTLNGRGSVTPMLDTSANFIRTLPLAVVLLLVFAQDIQITAAGFWLAVGSGAFASGIGYSLWYAALPSLTAIQAGVFQLTVPLIAALGGIVFVGESLTVRLVMASMLLLGGIGLVLWGKRQPARA